MVSTVPSRRQVQSPVVPIVAALAVRVNVPRGIAQIIIANANVNDKSFFISNLQNNVKFFIK